MIDSQGRVLTSRADSILVDQLCHEPVERGQIIAGVLVEPGGADGRHPPADVVLMHLGCPMVAPTVRVSEQSAPCVHHQPFVHRNVSRQSSGHQDDQRSGEIRRWYALLGSRSVYQHRIAGGHHHVVRVKVSVTKEISIWQRIVWALDFHSSGGTAASVMLTLKRSRQGGRSSTRAAMT